jgi:hypothetical protein
MDEEGVMQNRFLLRFFLLVSLLFSATLLFSQQIVVGTPFNSISDGYYERYGIGWGLNWRGGFASFGLPNQAIPPFGKFDPSSGLQTGWRFGNGNFNGLIYLTAAQGFLGTYASQSPFLTLTNGYPGAFYDLSLNPFVTGYTPVVGGFSPYGAMMPGVVPQNNFEQPNPLDRVQVMKRLLAAQNQGISSETAEPDPGQAMLPRHATDTTDRDKPWNPATGSSAERPVPSVAEAKLLYEREKNSANDEVSALYERAKAAEENGKPQLAKIYYQMVIKRSQGNLKQLAEQRVRAIEAVIAKKSNPEETPVSGKEF